MHAVTDLVMRHVSLSVSLSVFPCLSFYLWYLVVYISIYIGLSVFLAHVGERDLWTSGEQPRLCQDVRG